MSNTKPLQAMGRAMTVMWIIQAIWSPCTCSGYLNKCVNIPAPPLHGVMRYTGGTLTARLKCYTAGEDLPATAPGKGGVLTCDPAYRTFEFDGVKRQTCLKYRQPEGLVMKTRVIFTANECVTKNVKHLQSKILGMLERLVKCVPEMKCQWTKNYSRCDDNLNEHKKGHTKQIDLNAEFHISGYNPGLPVQTYLELSFGIKSSILTNLNAKVLGETFQVVQFRPLMASCSNHPGTSGTDLKIQRVASCRWCPLNHHMDVFSNRCQLCRPHFYTPPSMSTRECVRCPPRRLWKSRRLYLEACRVPL